MVARSQAGCKQRRFDLPRSYPALAQCPAEPTKLLKFALLSHANELAAVALGGVWPPLGM
jgi:hypothetical protein